MSVDFRDGKEEGKYCVCPVADSLCLFNGRDKVSQMVVVMHDVAKQEMIVKLVKFESEGQQYLLECRYCCITTVLENRTVRGYHIENVSR